MVEILDGVPAARLDIPPLEKLVLRVPLCCADAALDGDFQDGPFLPRGSWNADEPRSFLKAAKETEPQVAAFAALALDTGARKGELCGLRWCDVDLDGATVTFIRQLVNPGRMPEFGPSRTTCRGQSTSGRTPWTCSGRISAIKRS